MCEREETRDQVRRGGIGFTLWFILFYPKMRCYCFSLRKIREKQQKRNKFVVWRKVDVHIWQSSLRDLMFSVSSCWMCPHMSPTAAFHWHILVCVVRFCSRDFTTTRSQSATGVNNGILHSKNLPHSQFRGEACIMDSISFHADKIKMLLNTWTPTPKRNESHREQVEKVNTCYWTYQFGVAQNVLN